MEQDAASRARAARRRRRVITDGFDGATERARHALLDEDPEVRAAALGALARTGALSVPDVLSALEDGPATVRQRAADLARNVRGPGSRSSLPAALETALGDPDPLVVVNAAWFLGERRVGHAVPALADVAQQHDDVRCREAAVAALGAIGDVGGLPAVLAALDDKPTVRRRATVALAGFDDPRVEPALARSLDDKDWQVRQAAEELHDD
ncbi:MAG TPA: HEAT repeat domain-containing protein [Acidimicrobiales bacterium]|jgi:hypothetical protein